MAGDKGLDDDDHSHRHDGRALDCGGDGGGCGGGDDLIEESPSSGVWCSICLELVCDDGGRSGAKLQCGHEFHLDCIGSAFNIKGAMQCPNCRKVEKGQWLFANGSTRPLPEMFVEDWIPDEDFYGLSYPEMHYRVHWCPFGELSQVGSSFEELESPATTRHEFRGHHGIYAEHMAASPVGHSYLAYVGPLPPVPIPRPSGDNIDEPNLNHPWNGLSGQNENFNPHAINIPYHGWEHHSPPFSLPTGNHVTGSEPVHGETDASTRPRSYPHPFSFGYRSNPRTLSSFNSSSILHHPGSSVQTHERIQHSHSLHHQQQASNSPTVPPPILPLTRRGLQAPPPPSTDQNGGFYIFPPPSSSNQNPRELETDHFHMWERDWFSRFPVASRDLGWGAHHHPNSSLWHRHFS